MAELLAEHAGLSDMEAGAEAARLIWDDDADAAAIVDPRTPEFANAMIDTSVAFLRSSKGLIKRMIKQAAAGAEDLAIAQFQGIIEVIQNADDVRATEVRFALRKREHGRELLIVHNGQPVTCHNVLGMALPYLTTKTERLDQRGRFGIGMKTLRRIADAVSIHSAPYHFSGDQLLFERVGAEAALPGFYDPDTNTMLVVDLNDGFDEENLREWFEAWQPDGLLFLASVSRFRWCALDGSTISERSLRFSASAETGYLLMHPAITGLVRRRVDGPSDHWTVWSATIKVPAHLHPAHKARSDTTEISIALADGVTAPGLFIGFRSQIPLTVEFSIDAQFDPSTSREAIIENAWNSWLIDRSAEVAATIARGLLAEAPTLAWSLIPLASEQVGKDDDQWLMARFTSAFAKERTWLGANAAVNLAGEMVPLTQLSYEDEELTELLDGSDLEKIAPNNRALSLSVRDNDNRWRDVLNTIDVSTTIGTVELLASLAGGLFANKEPSWWVEAATCIVEHHPDDALFGTPFLLADDLLVIACAEYDTTDRPIVFETTPSAFALRWRLLDRLHPAFGEEEGKPVITWLTANAAFTSHLEPDAELAAFVERYSGQLLEITDDELREMRDSFDSVSSERRASQLGPEVGAILKLDGIVYKGGKPVRQKVHLAKAYLSKTLDGENSTWPDAAGRTPDLAWIAARYEEVLKTGAGRWAKRKREDGSVSRGPRRFLTLLGAETAPRIVRTEGRVRWGDGARVRELRARKAEQVQYDLLSPDLANVLKSLQKLRKREAKQRSPALLRTLSRNWERLYETKRRVPAEHMAIKYAYDRGEVTADWLNLLRETEWVAVGRGELVLPSVAVIRTPTTQALYQSFACNIGPEDLSPECAGALQLITDVRIGDLVSKLEELRDGDEDVQEGQVIQVYHTIAKRCPRSAGYNTRIGEMTAQDLRERFLAGRGLVYVGDGDWKRPDEVMRGMDIFHDRRSFVPGDAACANLWLVLDVREPGLDECIQCCRELAREAYRPDVEAALMDVYRYMEAHIDAAERRHREKLRQLPLYCDGTWVTERPLLWIEDSELRAELTQNVPGLHCWTPPCDVRALPSLMTQMAVETMLLSLSVEGDTGEAGERGEAMRLRFGYAVDHLSSELARSEPTIRDRIAVSWDTLKAMPLFVFEGRIPVRASSDHLPAAGVLVELRAFVGEQRQAISFCEDDIGGRDFGGRAIASFFPPEVRRRIDAEWALAWPKSRDSAAEAIRLASDEKRDEAMKETAAAINAGPKGKIKVTPPKSRDPKVAPRTLKQSVGQVAGATVQLGSGKPQPPKSEPSKGKLRTNPPEPGNSGSSNSRGLAPAAYTNADLEQRGWEILTQALETSPDQRLVDFRNRHGVGADGAFDWKRFVEMKATARGPQTQIELSNNEFARAKERGSDFILALVSGLETGQKDEARLIFDPANCATVRPANGVKLTALLDAPAVVIHFEDAAPEEGDSE